jgi:hypothetical protein
VNEVVISSFFDELIKIAQDPRVQEIAEIKSNPPDRSKAINREVLKQKAKNIAAIAGGAAVGEGAALLTNMGLRRAAEHYGRRMPGWVPLATQGIVAPAMGMGAHLAYSKMREKDRQLLEEARQRGIQQ